MTWLTPSSVLLMGGALVVPQAATGYQACAPMLPGPLPSNRVLYWDAEGVESTLSGLIGASQVIVVGRLDSVVCRVDTPFAPTIDAPMVLSKFTVVVESALRGSAPGARLSMIFHGIGRVVVAEGRSIQAEIGDFESLKVGDRVLLFLKPDAVDRDAFAISGMRQGIFRVMDGGTIRSPWRGIVRNPASVHAKLDGKKAADVLAEVARIIGR